MGCDIRHPEIDAEHHRALWSTAAPGEVPAVFRTSTIEDLVARRAGLANSFVDEAELRRVGVETHEYDIPGYDGGPDVSVLVLRPAGVSGPLPVLVHPSCGAKVLSHRRAVGAMGFVEWVTAFQIVIVSATIRTGPEHRHPAELHDSYATLLWTAKNADSLGVDPDRIGLVAGSGGGGVAAGTALYARDHGGPALSGLILFTPMIDDRDITVSNHFEGVGWDHDSNVAGWTALLGEARGGADVSEYAAAARAADLSGLPPMYLETGSADTFRDETLDFAARAGHAGVPVEVHSWAGLMHVGAQDELIDSELSKAQLAARHSYLRRVFGPKGGGLVANTRPGQA
ncbi:alpha/beta hydrolase [Streptomyces sp. NPDC051985]|uniref:alpha/beta hydrolase n=1 Tax=Streptomyces sp. NPDC051985 TaxID=3155807 RepID=UPI00341E28B0